MRQSSTQRAAGAFLGGLSRDGLKAKAFRVLAMVLAAAVGAGPGVGRGDGRGVCRAGGCSAVGARPGPAGGAGPRSPPPGRRSAARGRRRGPRQRLGPRVGSSPRGVQGSAVEEPCPLLRSFCTESSGFGWLRSPKNPERRETNRLTVTSRTPSATAICRCFQPSCFRCQARIRRHSRKSDGSKCSGSMPYYRAQKLSVVLQRSVLPRQKSFASLHILTRRASEGSEALPSLARRVRMSFFGARVISRSVRR